MLIEKYRIKKKKIIMKKSYIRWRVMGKKYVFSGVPTPVLRCVDMEKGTVSPTCHLGPPMHSDPIASVRNTVVRSYFCRLWRWSFPTVSTRHVFLRHSNATKRRDPCGDEPPRRPWNTTSNVRFRTDSLNAARLQSAPNGTRPGGVAYTIKLIILNVLYRKFTDRDNISITAFDARARKICSRFPISLTLCAVSHLKDYG
jgi:hypothetical protein